MDKLAQDFGQITPPTTAFTGKEAGVAIGSLIQVIISLLIVGAGVYTLINLVIAGYGFLSAGDDPKKITSAWAQIWQSLLGLAITAGAFVLAAIFGQLIFGRWDFILKPTINPIK